MKNKIIKNIFILGMSGIAAKSFDFLFRAYYSRMLGTEGMGLLSLGFSLHSVMLTFSTAGLGVAVSKITSEYMEQNNPTAVKICMHSALFGVSLLSLVVTLITFLFSGKIASVILGDGRVSVSLCTLAPSVIFMGISYCLKGCFYASRKIAATASSEILEQIVKFISIKVLLDIFLPYGIEYGCAAVFGGITIGEFSSCAYLSFFYIRDEKRYYGLTSSSSAGISSTNLVCRLLGVSIPSMITSLCCSFLRMKEEVLIISALRRGNMSHSEAVGALGIIHGMAMPLLVLPLNLTGSVMSFLVPEISRAGVRSRNQLRHKAFKAYKLGGAVGIAVGIVFMLFGEKLTGLVYNNLDAAPLVVYLAPLCPIMFIDSLSCSILNGLGKQTRLLGFTLADFALRLSIIYFALPHGKMAAFAMMVAVSNIFTCALSFGSVMKLICGGFKLTKHSKCGIVNKR